MQVDTLPEVRNVRLFRAAHCAIGSPVLLSGGEVGGVSNGCQRIWAGRTKSALALKCERHHLAYVGSDRLCSAASIRFEFTYCWRIRAAFVEYHLIKAV